jgi:AraC family transcriptional regulator, chitin signaling transcriptional activator
MEFGYFKRNAIGKLDYISLSTDIDVIEDEIIWHIRVIDNQVVFQSLDRLYIFDRKTKELNIITDEKSYVRTFVTDNQFFIQKKNKGIYKLEKGTEKLYLELPPGLRNDLIVNFVKTSDGYLLFSRHEGIYKVKDGKLNRFNSDYDLLFPNKKIFSALYSNANEIFLGTISEGLVKMDENGKLLGLITQGSGLSNNTILNLYEDAQSNLWLALDNGIDCLNNQSYVTEYNNTQGVLGTVYTTITYNDGLYLGSNQGLFFKELNGNKSLQLIAGSEGQVWSLFESDGVLFCGHALGIFKVSGNSAKLIVNIPGVWDFREIIGHPDKILFGSYSGLGVLHKDNEEWKRWNKLDGFELSSRFFEFSDSGHIWVSHENKGVYLLELDLENKRVTIEKEIKTLPSHPGSSLAKFDGQILYSTKDGVFNLSQNGTYQKNEGLSSLIDPQNYLSAKLIEDKLNDRIWSFSKKGISFARKSPTRDNYEIKSYAIPDYLRRSVVSFENLRAVAPDEYILGKTNGYIRLDFSKEKIPVHSVIINQVLVSGDSSYSAPLSQKSNLPYHERSLTISYNVPYFEKYKDIEFSYRLIGYQDQWSDWKKESKVKFEKLPFGEYTFEVKSKIGETISSNIARFDFEIERPVYLSIWAFIIYLLLFVVIIFAVHKAYKRYFQRKAEVAKVKNQQELETIRIKTEQKITDLKNKQLEVEIDSKNRELAILTMNNIKRNDFLRKVKKELKTQTKLPDNSTVYKLIDSNLNNEKDWEFFEEAFNNADKEFLERAKKICPELNHNDLKFCTYIRLNLSAKEIASLLNISTKSVEIRRYRLRKKLGLDSEVNLTDFILSI